MGQADGWLGELRPAWTDSKADKEQKRRSRIAERVLLGACVGGETVMLTHRVRSFTELLW